MDLVKENNSSTTGSENKETNSHSAERTCKKCGRSLGNKPMCLNCNTINMTKKHKLLLGIMLVSLTILFCLLVFALIYPVHLITDVGLLSLLDWLLEGTSKILK